MSACLEERDLDDCTPLSAGTAYTAVLTVSEEESDGRYGGLLTRWVVASSTVRLEAHPEGPDVVVGEQPGGGGWQATFELRTPEEGDAAHQRLRITPVAIPEARLEADVYVGPDLYRRLVLSLAVAEAGGPDAARGPSVVGPAVAHLSVGTLPVAHAGLAPEVDWQRPRQRLTVAAGFGSGCQVRVVRGDELESARTNPWPAVPGGIIETRVTAVRRALDQLRQAFPDYFESITAEQLAEDLAVGPPPVSWADEENACSEPFQESWSEVVEGRELRELAYAGHQLYRAVFDEQLRSSMEQLEPGDRVDVIWLDEGGRGGPHLPLPLMYTGPVTQDVPVDPTRFLGLRHRIAYTRREAEGSRALGSWKLTTRAHILYESAQAGDIVAAEARRHAAELARWTTDDGRARFLPGGAPLTEVSRFLASPGPAPVSLLYFYCHCVTGDGVNPYLRLGPTNADTDILRGMDIGTEPFVDRPLVFVNACESSSADPLLVNQLMDSFFARQCRAYIGTEGRVPPGVAARFATVFFTALYGTAWGVLSPVGEAVAQARRFLWRRYRNLGGLFYGYVNDYALYAADDEHVVSLRR